MSSGLWSKNVSIDSWSVAVCRLCRTSPKIRASQNTIFVAQRALLINLLGADLCGKFMCLVSDIWALCLALGAGCQWKGGQGGACASKQPSSADAGRLAEG